MTRMNDHHLLGRGAAWPIYRFIFIRLVPIDNDTPQYVPILLHRHANAPFEQRFRRIRSCRLHPLLKNSEGSVFLLMQKMFLIPFFNLVQIRICCLPQHVAFLLSPIVR